MIAFNPLGGSFSTFYNTGGGSNPPFILGVSQILVKDTDGNTRIGTDDADNLVINGPFIYDQTGVQPVIDASGTGVNGSAYLSFDSIGDTYFTGRYVVASSFTDHNGFHTSQGSVVCRFLANNSDALLIDCDTGIFYPTTIYNLTQTYQLIDASVSGENDSAFMSFDNAGNTYLTGSLKINGPIYLPQFPTSSAPAYASGKIYYDTTLHKLRIGGAAGWETVTSV
jgi:hypothetical protein